MKKLKKKILFTLGHSHGILQGKSDFPYFALEELYWRLRPFAQSSTRDALIGLNKQKLVVKMERDGKVYYRLTSIGREYIYEFSGISLRRQKVWDKGWRMVIMDSGALVPNQVRWLRGQLINLGMKSLSRGVWVTPLDISQEIKKVLIEEGVGGGVVVVVTRRFMVGDDKAFAERVWKLLKLRNSYQEIISDCGRLLKNVRSAKSLNDRLKKEFLTVFDRWYELLPLEPKLPKTLLPDNWASVEAANEFNKLAESVLELEREHN